MQKWGVVVSLFYALIVLVLLVPAAAFLAGNGSFDNVREVFGCWVSWVPIGAVLSGQALLLFLSVDTSRKRLKPRAHILVSCSAGAMLFALLCVAAIFDLWAGVLGDSKDYSLWWVLAVWLFLWLTWGILLYRHLRDSSGLPARIFSWLLKGSVLELLIAVPCHVVVRRRGDCSAPVATAFGIVTGIAIMLLSFGPSLLFLYRKRLDTYASRRP